MMRLTLALAVLALAGGGAQAASSPSGGGVQTTNHPPLRHRVAYRRTRLVRPLRLTAEMRDDATRAPAISQATLHQDGYLTPVVSHPLGAGAYASLGYQSGVVHSALAPGELNGAASTRLSHPESAAGVRVGIPF